MAREDFGASNRAGEATLFAEGGGCQLAVVGDARVPRAGG